MQAGFTYPCAAAAYGAAQVGLGWEHGYPQGVYVLPVHDRHKKIKLLKSSSAGTFSIGIQQ